MVCSFVSNGLGSTNANVMLKKINTFFIKGINIYFGHKDKVYVISKQPIVDVFGVCVKGYVRSRVKRE
jgi:hypothetical protein